jgi:hypothetical protein
MDVVIEIFVKYPGGRTRITVTDILSVRINSKRIWLFRSGERDPIRRNTNVWVLIWRRRIKREKSPSRSPDV